MSRRDWPPSWPGDREQRQGRDREQRRAAERFAGVFPHWVVPWGAYSRQFWGFPRFAVPRGTIARAAGPGDLAAIMRSAGRSARDGWR